MKIGIFLAVIFILLFGFLFWFVHHENKKENEKDNLLTLVIIAILFSMILTAIIAFFLFLIIGSANVMNTLFSLNLNSSQLILIGISYLIYWMTADNIIEKFFEYLWGENIYAILSLAVARIATFYIIGIILNLDIAINMTISIGISVILLGIDLLFFQKRRLEE
ncbi:hypothetical protein [Psychrobacillus sp. NPDC093180]|uniref:hypothetical protein n=1 Tax=Psychrobacillus sp. NPDC093180 TaxID=3364489 RepID=UPI0037FD62F5